MIRSFRHKGLKRLFEDGDRKGIRADYIEKIENILAVLHRARAPEDMNLPGFRLHPLKGEMKGFHAVTVRANYPGPGASGEAPDQTCQRIHEEQAHQPSPQHSQRHTVHRRPPEYVDALLQMDLAIPIADDNDRVFQVQHIVRFQCP
ncbi:MAG: hypothetical protein HP492_10580 [Nitrospira sp.]|nr:hypothetical protein [Nitrospira sp.]